MNKIVRRIRGVLMTAVALTCLTSQVEAQGRDIGEFRVLDAADQALVHDLLDKMVALAEEDALEDEARVRALFDVEADWQEDPLTPMGQAGVWRISTSSRRWTETHGHELLYSLRAAASTVQSPDALSTLNVLAGTFRLLGTWDDLMPRLEARLGPILFIPRLGSARVTIRTTGSTRTDLFVHTTISWPKYILSVGVGKRPIN